MQEKTEVISSEQLRTSSSPVQANDAQNKGFTVLYRLIRSHSRVTKLSRRSPLPCWPLYCEMFPFNQKSAKCVREIGVRLDRSEGSVKRKAHDPLSLIQRGSPRPVMYARLLDDSGELG